MCNLWRDVIECQLIELYFTEISQIQKYLLLDLRVIHKKIKFCSGIKYFKFIYSRGDISSLNQNVTQWHVQLQHNTY